MNTKVNMNQKVTNSSINNIIPSLTIVHFIENGEWRLGQGIASFRLIQISQQRGVLCDFREQVFRFFSDRIINGAELRGIFRTRSSFNFLSVNARVSFS